MDTNPASVSWITLFAEAELTSVYVTFDARS